MLNANGPRPPTADACGDDGSGGGTARATSELRRIADQFDAPAVEVPDVALATRSDEELREPRA